MRFGANRSQLYDGQKTARAQWDATGELWADQARQSFHEELWEPLDRNVSDVLRAVDQLGVLFAQIRAECEFGS
ncbi:MAG: hypothetical protein ACRCZF_20965 [Gemmataceae bacterium]